MRRIVMAVLLFGASVATAAPSARYADWASGPVKWLMTRDDQRAWRTLADDRAAQEFVDLFWARRDPTPGTPDNEFRAAFEQRVIAADRTYTSEGTRGSLTEPGRVLILLGPPRFWTSGETGEVPYTQPPDPPRNTAQPVNSPKPQIYAQRELIFDYDCLSCVHLTKPLRLVWSSLTREYTIDPQLSNATGALDFAVSRAIRNPELKNVPAWAHSSDASLEVTLVSGGQSGRNTDATAYPAGVSRALKDVRSVLQYKRYRLEDRTVLQAKAGRQGESRVGGIGTTYRVIATGTRSPDGQSIRVGSFKVAPWSGGETLIATDFTIAPGETISVGTSAAGGGDALIFFVTALP